MNKLKLGFILIIVHLAGCSIHSANGNTPPPPPAAVSELPTSDNLSSSLQTESPKEPGQNTLQPIDVSSVNTKDPLVGGATEKSMDANDKIKMSKALDKAPGKSTEWVNERTGVTYNVTPIKKVVINNNPFCREYEVMITRRSSSSPLRGTACIGDDGNWHSL